MSVSVISLAHGTSTIRIMRRELRRIERATGIYPEDWMQEIHDDAVDLYMTDNDFDFDAFDMHMSCTADSFIDFWNDHHQHLNNNLYSPS
jgi:hypothetical protein